MLLIFAGWNLVMWYMGRREVDLTFIVLRVTQGGSVGRLVPGRLEGRSGSETGSEISEIMISGDLRPWKSPQRRIGQGRSAGPTRVGTEVVRAGGSVGRGR